MTLDVGGWGTTQVGVEGPGFESLLIERIWDELGSPFAKRGCSTPWLTTSSLQWHLLSTLLCYTCTTSLQTQQRSWAVAEEGYFPGDDTTGKERIWGSSYNPRPWTALEFLKPYHCHRLRNFLNWLGSSVISGLMLRKNVGFHYKLASLIWISLLISSESPLCFSQLKEKGFDSNSRIPFSSNISLHPKTLIFHAIVFLANSKLLKCFLVSHGKIER